jgi:hypothetical protein
MIDRPVQLTSEEKQRRRRRSVALGLILAGLVALFYVITIVKLGPGVINRPL